MKKGDLKCQISSFFNGSLKLKGFRTTVLGISNDVNHLMQSFLTKTFVVGFGDDYFLTLSYEVANRF